MAVPVKKGTAIQLSAQEQRCAVWTFGVGEARHSVFSEESPTQRPRSTDSSALPTRTECRDV